MDSIHAKNFLGIAKLIALSLILSACGQGQTSIDTGTSVSSSFNWQLPSRYPLPVEPVNNPMTEEKFELGRHLFYDTRLSGNGTQACASCHHQQLAFTDGRTTSIGSTGEVLAANAQGLMNAAYNATQTWANHGLTTLEQQALIPLFGEAPIEHGINEANRDTVLQAIRDEQRYQRLFAEAYPELGDPIDFTNIRNAITSFIRGMVSFNSAYDQFEQGIPNTMTDAQHRGRKLFFSERMECFHCHGGYHLSDSTLDRTMTIVERPFHNTGLYNLGGNGDYPDANQGLFTQSQDPADMGKFRAQSLRNIAVTAPYMHDGSVATLSEVIDNYAAGGRVITSGPNAGDGRINPFKDGFVSGFPITPEEKADLIAFLEALTDHSFINNPRFANPWEATNE